MARILPNSAPNSSYFRGAVGGKKAIITALEEPVGIVVFGTVIVLVTNISAVLAPPDANGTIITIL